LQQLATKLLRRLYLLANKVLRLKNLNNIEDKRLYILKTESACLAELGLPFYVLSPQDQLNHQGYNQVYYNILGLICRRGHKPERLVPKIKKDLILVFYKIQLILIFTSNKIIVKKALVCLCKQLKKLFNNTKIIKKKYKIVLITCISCR
jgi:hypothetical protein